VIMVAGTKAHADALWDEVAQVIAPLGLHLSAEKSRVCHLDEGFDFLRFCIQRRRRKGTTKASVYTYPSKKSLLSIMVKVPRRRLGISIPLSGIGSPNGCSSGTNASRGRNSTAGS